ncbi:MAG: pyridoxamine 5'-phosphate oxidase family protein [Deltaproteobacteria bacterium]|nr:pyridoxamine 5'-phosphate oxidase family protein [Deltaproteobacteria bacterium]
MPDQASPDAGELKKLAEELIGAQTTMTLATVRDCEAWAAPVYYAHRGFRFYFFSDPSSRHIQEALENRQVSAAIFCQASSWREIRGTQMSGTVGHLSPGFEALAAIRTYLRKFPFTREFFDPTQKINLEAFASRFKVRLYVFRPSLLYYLDNRIRFGFREALPLD